MSILKDFHQQHLHVRKTYWPREIFNLSNWARTLKWRRQRMERGWSDRDTWAGGEHIVEVTAGILRYLETTIIDWPAYFEMNYEDNYGYTSLSEVAQDLDNYIYFEERQYEDAIYKEFDMETRWAIQIQLYSQAEDAMVFVAKNIGGLWW